jgi:hypothetical protein
MFGPQGKEFAEFCFLGDDDVVATSRLASKAAMLSSRNKRDFNGIEVSGGMDRALQHHNNIMVAKMMVKYGTEEDKLNALAVLREIFTKEKENTTETASLMETIDIMLTANI